MQSLAKERPASYDLAWCISEGKSERPYLNSSFPSLLLPHPSSQFHQQNISNTITIDIVVPIIEEIDNDHLKFLSTNSLMSFADLLKGKTDQPHRGMKRDQKPSQREYELP